MWLADGHSGWAPAVVWARLWTLNSQHAEACLGPRDIRKMSDTWGCQRQGVCRLPVAQPSPWAIHPVLTAGSLVLGVLKGVGGPTG